MYRVMLVDDCLPDITGIAENLDWASLHCEVAATAANGEVGIKKAQELKPDIIITDVSMPVMNGIDMTRLIKKDNPDISFIFISCFDEFSYVKSAIDYNVSAYILKPIKLDELYEAVKNVVDSLDKKRKYEKLESSFKKFSANQTENFLSDLLLSEEFDTEYANLLNIPYNEHFYLLLLTQADDSKTPPAEFYNKLTELKDVCEKHADSKKNYFLKFGVSSLVVLLHGEQPDDIKLGEYIQTLTQYTDPYGNIFLSFSAEPVRLSEISKTFNRLLESLSPKDSLPDMQNLYQTISGILFSDEPEDILTFADFYFSDEIRKNLIYSKTVSMQILNTVNLILNEHNKSFSDIFDDEFVVWNKLFNFSTIVNIKQWIINLLCAVRSCLTAESSQKDKYELTASKIKSFINEHFSSPTILDDVADAVGLSVNHANSIFKTITGQTMFSYAVNMRINHAKLLLADHTLSVSSISREVGYASSSYFTTAFKKNVGVSPQQYRSHNLSSSKSGEDE